MVSTNLVTASPQKLGILGGGQLGRMMIPAIEKFGLEAYFLDPNPECPVSELTDNLVVGNFRDYETVLNFGRSVDIITIEIEHVNVEALEQLESEGKIVRPSAKLIRIIQDKGLQKQFYLDHGIPTSEFRLIESEAEIEQHTDLLPFAQKLRTGGYDGQGVKIFKKSLFNSPFGKGRDNGLFNNALVGPSVLERLVDIDQELSVIVARTSAGEIKTFPTVGQTFDPEANLVKFVYAPAEISVQVDRRCQDLAKQIAEQFELEGILAVEFFLSRSGEILVNEVAPRAHNSGHWTIDGAETSQFEQLVRAVYGFDLGSTEILHPTVMVNLLGPKGFMGEADGEVVEERLTQLIDNREERKEENAPLIKGGALNLSEKQEAGGLSNTSPLAGGTQGGRNTTPPQSLNSHSNSGPPSRGGQNTASEQGDKKTKTSPLASRTSNLALHWYGKTLSKPMRKMGHINVWADTLIEAKELAEEVWQIICPNKDSDVSLKLIDIDGIKKALDGYRPDIADKFHTESAKIADRLCDEELKRLKGKNSQIVFMCGGSASGKSEFIQKFGLLLQDFDGFVFDSTFSTIAGAEIKIKKVIKSGNIPIIYLVLPKDINRAFKAFHERERKIPIERFFETHSGSRRTALWVAENFSDVQIFVYENQYDKTAANEDHLLYEEVLFDSREELIDFLRTIQYTETDIKATIYK